MLGKIIIDKKNTVIINFHGNCMAKIQVVNDKVRVLNAIDGWVTLLIQAK